MKKLQNLSEVQKIGALGISLASLGYASVVALFAHYADLLATMTLCALLVAFGSVTTGVIVGMMKDEQLARVVRGARYTTNAIIAERDELSDLLENSRADLRDEVARVRILSAQVMSDTETIDDLRTHNETLGNKCVNYQIQRNRAVNTVDGLRTELESVESQLNDSHSRETELRAERDNLREISQARALNAEKLRAEVRELTERVEIIQESRHSYRDLYRAVIAEREQAELDEQLDADYDTPREHAERVSELSENATKRDIERAYTMSASTAFALGTLDRAYEVEGETRYPVK